MTNTVLLHDKRPLGGPQATSQRASQQNQPKSSENLSGLLPLFPLPHLSFSEFSSTPPLLDCFWSISAGDDQTSLTRIDSIQDLARASVGVRSKRGGRVGGAYVRMAMTTTPKALSR